MASLLASGPVSFASITGTAATTTLKAGATGYKTRVLALALVAGAAGCTVELVGGSTRITGQMPLAANGILVLPFSEGGW